MTAMRSMRLQRWGSAWLWLGGPTPPGAAAITLGRLVIVSRRASARDDLGDLLTHELVHVRQWRELGVARFLWRYLSSYARWRLRGYGHWAAYRRIPLEIEARWATRPQRWGELLDAAPGALTGPVADPPVS